MASVAATISEFDRAVAYSLSRLGKSELKLKSEQKASIRHVYDGKDVFVWLPTGFGKSICYEVLPFVYDFKATTASDRGRSETTRSLVVVISPLISLMVDQVMSLRRWGVSAAIISLGRGVEKELIATAEDLATCSLLFCVPEVVVSSKWRETLAMPVIAGRVVAVVVDEAHCVSKWSKEFRPAYGRLHELRALLPPGVPYLACTATVTRSVRQEVISSLDMGGCEFVSTSPDRSNIFYEVLPRADVETDLQPVLKSLQEYKNQAPRVIVYCHSLNICSDLYAHFHFELGDGSYYPPGAPHVSDNRLFGMYHSNTPQHNKDVILRSLVSPTGVVRVVFATVALGMGVDLRDVNCVIHYGAPQSIDDYFQESGRGGRSGGDAKSIIYWKPADCPYKREPVTTRDHEVNAVRRYVQNTTDCRRRWLLEYFDHLCTLPSKDSKRCCDICARQ